MNKQAGKGPHPDEPPSSRQKLDEVISFQQFRSMDIMASVGRFLEGPHHDFDEVTRSIFKLYT